jgi:hypothetical protein
MISMPVRSIMDDLAHSKGSSSSLAYTPAPAVTSLNSEAADRWPAGAVRSLGSVDLSFVGGAAAGKDLV